MYIPPRLEYLQTQLVQVLSRSASTPSALPERDDLVRMQTYSFQRMKIHLSLGPNQQANWAAKREDRETIAFVYVIYSSFAKHFRCEIYLANGHHHMCGNDARCRAQNEIKSLLLRWKAVEFYRSKSLTP